MAASVFLIISSDMVTVFFTLDITENTILLLSESILLGSVGMVFGFGLIKLQDGMGRIALGAGILEITIGISYIVVFLFFLGAVLSVPAVILEIVLLFKTEEYIRGEASK